MKMTIESTPDIVTIETPQGEVPARVWMGTTERGIPVQVLVTRIAVQSALDNSQFEKELKQTPAPDPAGQVFPLRMVL